MRAAHPALVLTICAALSFAAAVSAQTTSTNTPRPAPAIKPPPVTPASTPPPAPAAASPTLIQGRDFGRHVSAMAPEHPKQHGAMFGECVSELARTGICPHHEEEEAQ